MVSKIQVFSSLAFPAVVLLALQGSTILLCPHFSNNGEHISGVSSSSYEDTNPVGLSSYPRDCTYPSLLPYRLSVDAVTLGLGLQHTQFGGSRERRFSPKQCTFKLLQIGGKSAMNLHVQWKPKCWLIDYTR